MEKPYLGLLLSLNYPTINNNIHESLFRSYHILNTIEMLLEKNVPSDVVLSLLKELRDRPHVKDTLTNGEQNE